ncbi:carbamate kinase, partial [Citrobacter farmeri]
LISTGVEQVAVNFGTPEQRGINSLTIAEAQQLLKEGQFGEGSMQPKVEAIVDFVSRSQSKGRSAKGLITSPNAIHAALQHKTGTWIGEE